MSDEKNLKTIAKRDEVRGTWLESHFSWQIHRIVKGWLNLSENKPVGT